MGLIDFPVSFIWRYVEQFVLNSSEAYVEPSWTSTMELFFQNSWQLLAVNHFYKKAPL